MMCRFESRQPVEITSEDLAFKVKLFNDSITQEEKENNWRGCAKIRMQDLRGSKIFENWPQYKSPDGYRLVIHFLFSLHSYSLTQTHILFFLFSMLYGIDRY